MHTIGLKCGSFAEGGCGGGDGGGGGGVGGWWHLGI